MLTASTTRFIIESSSFSPNFWFCRRVQFNLHTARSWPVSLHQRVRLLRLAPIQGRISCKGE